MLPKLGILAGGGELPVRLVELCRATGRDVFVVAFNGESNPDAVRDVDHVWQNLGAVGSTIQALKDADCGEVVLAGPIRRPKLSALGLDRRGAAMLPKLLRAKGDDALLSVVIGELEAEGFGVVGADDVLSQLLASDGAAGAHQPSEEDWRDIERGIEVVRAIGAVDVGQAAVVHRGYVLGVEAAEGTDALIERTAPLRHDEQGGVLVKLRKPGQDRRADLPTIGVATVERAAAARLSGIALEAGETLILGREDVIRLADERGLFIVGVTTPETSDR